MIESNSTSNNIDKKVQTARLAYAQAHDHLENYVLTVVDTSKIKKLSAFYGIVDQAVESLQQYVKVSGTVKSEHPIRKPARYAISVLKTLRDDVESKETTLKRVQKVSATKVKDYLIDMQDANDKLLAEQQANPLADAERDFITTKEAFTRYSKYQRKLPSKLKRPDSFQIAEIPVMARFTGRVGSVSFLKSINVEYTPIGFDGNTSSDIGIVFEKQNLLMFSKEAALANATLLYLEDLTGLDLDTKDYLFNPEKYIKEVKQSYFKKFSDKKRELKKKIKQAYTQVAQSLNITKKGDIQEFISDRMEDDTTKSNFDYAKAISKKFDKDLVKEVMRSVRPLIDDIDKAYKLIADQDQNKKTEERRLREVEKSKLDEPSVLLKYASAAVDEISKQTGHDYVVLSTQSRQNPRNSDIVMFWIVPKVFSKVLNSFSDNGMSVSYWDLPWSKKKQPRRSSTKIPKSIELSVKMPRGM